MKTTHFLCFVLLLTSLTLHGQGTLTTITPNPVSPNYSGTLTITGTGTTFTNATAGLNLRLTHATNGQVYNFGNAPFGTPWAGAGSPTTISGNITLPGNAPPGMYHVYVAGFSGYNYGQNVTVNANSFFQVAGNVAYFDGQLVMDLDSNCSKNGADYGIGNRLITATPGPYYGTTDANGNFHLALPTGTYTFSASNPNGTLMICPGFPYTQSATQNTINATTSGINFFVKSDHAADVTSSIQLFNHRPGFSNNYAGVSVTNATSTPANNVVLKFVKPSNFTWHTFMNGSPTVNADTATYVIGTMGANQSLTFGTNVQVPIGTPLGTPFTYYSIATTSSSENVTTNNNDTKTGVITGGYDPNDKQVWTTNGANANGFVEPTDSLFRYLIRFQNTGNDTAFNIIVRDTFDADFDMGTLSIVGYSHPMTLQVPDSTGRRIHFAFNNILLVDSTTNEPLSHGYVEYSIRKKNGLANGTVLTNRASIYFDFNVPVHTNAVNSTICPSLGTSFTFTTSNLTATLHGPTTGSANGWAWNFGDGQTGTGANPVHTYATGGTYNVCVTVTNACGRSKQICLPVTVTCAPFNAAFTNSVNGMSVNFTNVSTGPFSSLLWQFGDGLTSTQSNPAHTYTMPGIYNACLIVTNACGTQDTTCTSLALGCTSVPVAAFTSNTTANVVNFANSSTGSFLTYFWNFGDGTNSTANSPAHTYSAVGTYVVCLTVTDACQIVATQCDTVTITCVTPVTSFVANVNQNTVAFTDQTTQFPYAWAWDFGDGGTSNVANPTHTYAAVGNYTVCLMTTNACGMSDSCSDVPILVVVGLEGLHAGTVSLLPNPAEDRVQLRMVDVQLESAEFKLYDAVGRVVRQWKANGIQGEYVHEMDLSDRAAGVYLLGIEAEGAVRTLRLVKH